MTLKWKLIVHAVAITILCGGVALLVHKCSSGKVKIKYITVEIPATKKTPSNYSECMNCFNSALHIDAEMLADNIIGLNCYDDCKSVSRKIKTNCAPPSIPRKNSIIPRASLLIGYGDGGAYMYGGGIMYMRKWYFPKCEIGFGGGINILRMEPFDASKKRWMFGGVDVAASIDF
jgi:hypothetical protein